MPTKSTFTGSSDYVEIGRVAASKASEIVLSEYKGSHYTIVTGKTFTTHEGDTIYTFVKGSQLYFNDADALKQFTKDLIKLVKVLG